MKKFNLFLFLFFLMSFSSMLMAQYTQTDLQNAIDAALPGDIITLNTGTYVLGSVVNVNKTNITLKGNSTLFQVSGTGDRLDISAAGVTIEDLQIQKTDKTGEQNIIRLRANNITIKNNTIWGQFVIGDAEVSRALVFNAGAYTGLQIEGNTFHSLRQPAYISGTNTGNIINNYTYNTKGWVLEGGNLTFTNNTWGINVFDIAIIPACPAIYYTDIVAMSNANNDAVIEDQRVSPAVLSVVHVDASTSFTTDLGGAYHPYSTIQPSLTRVVDGGKIIAANGTYYFTSTLNFNKSVTLIGESEAGVILDVSGTAASSWGINPNKSNTSIRNLTIIPNAMNGGYPIHVGDNMVPIVISNISLSHITVNGAKKTPFDFNGVDNLTIEHLTATNTASGNGIALSGCVNVTASNITTNGNAWGGLAIYASNPLTGVGRGSDIINIDGTSCNFGEANKIYNQDEFGFFNTNIFVTGFDYQVKNSSLAGYTFYQITQPEALTFAAALSNPFNSSVKQISTGQYFVNPSLKIQAAVNAGTSGDIINVAAGTYEEQVTVDNKSLSIIGAGNTNTFINSPAVLTTTFSTSNPYKCVVGVINNGNLIVQDLTVNGLGRGNVNNRFIGIGFSNSAGTVQNCKVLDIRDTPFSGVQHGVAIFSYNDDAISRVINVLDNEIVGFQKNAMALNASDSNPLTVNVSGNTVIGAGATGITAQNGIQVSGDIVTGSIQNNSLTGIGYSGSSWVATTILNFYADIDIISNNVTEGHVGVYNIDGSANISNNIINTKKIGDYGYGIIATDPPQAMPSPFDSPVNKNILNDGPEALISVLLDSNIVNFSGSDNTSTYGIEADAGYGLNDLSILATNNTISGFGVGISVYQFLDTITVGVFTSIDFNHNNILNNVIGFETNLTEPVFAENNWWGTAIESEIQAMISGPVDYDPWIGKTSVLSCPNVNVNYNFMNGVIIRFTTLPNNGGNVTVMRENKIPASPPIGVTNLGLWIDITSSMPNFTFNGIVTVDVNNIPGFNANTKVMYKTSTGNWMAIAGGEYNLSDVLFGGHPSYAFATNHFTPFTFINTPASAYDVYLSSSTAPAAGIIFPNDAWGYTLAAYEPNDWDFTAPIELYIVPQVGSVFGASDITIQWDNTLFSYAGVSATGGIYDNANSQFISSQTGNQLTINAGRFDNTNVTIGADDYIAKLNLNLLKPGFAPVSFIALDFRAYDGLGGQLGVYVTGNNAQIKSYLGDVASTSPVSETSGDGFVNFDDLSPWSVSYWSGVGSTGMANYKVKYDVGPTTTNTVYGLPIPDGKIQFEDFVIFAMSFGLSASDIYPKLNAQPTAPVELQLGDPIISGNQTRVPLFVSGGVQNVRAMNLTFAGTFGKLVSVEKGTLLNELVNPVMVMSNVEGNQVFVDLAVFGADELGISKEGEVLTLIFEGNTDININTADIRNILNSSMAVNIAGSVETVPTEFALMQNYPNPFNPSTMISYSLPKQSMVEISVFNALGEKVATLVNELKEAGRYSVELNAGGFSSGIYFYQITANEFVSVKKMILMK